MSTKAIKPTASIFKDSSHLTFVLSNKTFSITKNDSFWDKAVEAYRKGDWATVISFVDRPQYIARYSEGRVQVTDDAVLYEGKELAGYVVNKILSFMEKGLPIGPIVRFLEDLQSAKAEHVKEDLYKFLELNDLPLTEDGGFLAYKLVQDNGKPFYQTSSDIVYRVGETYEMPYEACDTSRDECGRQGLHLGNKTYWSASEFDKKGDYTGAGRMLLVKCMPSAVVSVPSSAGGAKLRAYRFEVIAEYNKADRKQEAHVKEVAPKEFVLESEYDHPPISKRDAYGRFIGGVTGRTLPKPSFKRAKNGRFIPKKVATVCPTYNKSPKRGKGGRFI